MNSDTQLAIEQLKKGNFIVLYDGDNREGEADLIFHAKFADFQKIARLRDEAGGLICLATDKEVANGIGLPFFADLFNDKSTASKVRCHKTAYGDKPAFSLPINHNDVYTGITDNDRALTIAEFARIVDEDNGIKNDFINNFYIPGHVFLLIGSGIENRRGHTELSLELAKRAGLSPTMVLCEMLDVGNALNKEKAIGYAKKHNLVFLEGKDL